MFPWSDSSSLQTLSVVSVHLSSVSADKMIIVLKRKCDRWFVNICMMQLQPAEAVPSMNFSTRAPAATLLAEIKMTSEGFKCDFCSMILSMASMCNDAEVHCWIGTAHTHTQKENIQHMLSCPPEAHCSGITVHLTLFLQPAERRWQAQLHIIYFNVSQPHWQYGSIVLASF